MNLHAVAHGPFLIRAFHDNGTVTIDKGKATERLSICRIFHSDSHRSWGGYDTSGIVNHLREQKLMIKMMTENDDKDDDQDDDQDNDQDYCTSTFISWISLAYHITLQHIHILNFTFKSANHLKQGLRTDHPSASHRCVKRHQSSEYIIEVYGGRVLQLVES